MIIASDIVSEVSWKTSRSGGKGGQNVNKVETKVELLWDIDVTQLLSDELKTKIKLKLESNLNKDGFLSVTCDTTRSQHENKEQAVKKLLTLLKKALYEPKKRLATKPSKASKERKLTAKKNRGYIKTMRGRIDFD